MGYKRDPTTFLTDAQQRVLNILAGYGSASPHQIWESPDLGLGKTMIQRHLKTLVARGLAKKLGSPPHVVYAATPSETPSPRFYDLIMAFATSALQQQMLGNYFGFDADFTLYRGEDAFKRWFYQKQVPSLLKQQSRKTYLADQLEANFYKLLQAFTDARSNIASSIDPHLSLIDATQRYRSIHHADAIKRVFYQDFYSLPQFGKSLLGLQVQKAKVGEVSSLPYIEEIAGLMRHSLPKLIEAFSCDSCAWVPHTLKRTYPLQDLLQKKVDLHIKAIRIAKIVAGDVVPQKSLSELAQRLHNATVTNHIAESPVSLAKLRSLLLIDDAIGSNATMHAIALKIKAINPRIEIIAFAPVGSFKGFDIIRDI